MSGSTSSLPTAPSNARTDGLVSPPLSVSGDALAASGLSLGELERLVAIARRAAEAGGTQLRRFDGQLEQVREKGRAGDLVTEADLAAEAAVLAFLEAETPQIGVLAEESGRRQRSGDLEWCVDPLDGTTNYAHGFPFYGTSVGLTWQGQPLLGALAAPGLDQLYWAAPGLGSWCNGHRLQVSPCGGLSDALLATGFAYDRTTRLDNNYAEFAYFTHRSHGVRRAGAAALDLAFVAAGRLDGYWERGLSPWDLAAGVVLVEQAGGLISSYDGSPFDLSSGRLIACGPQLHGGLVAGLAACRPLSGASFGAPELDGP
ncbi:inositol monophosphatase family protein [Synechococcus sp. CCY9201]|uniref:inositol monophosphatase family protein n=1 Tax=unclassified Synechococcus TaxID=2626047 RepID=UPI002AD383E7|nr:MULTISPECIES: inositol monophosphatase family protein [unclassified Synechococcus]MEA5424461.1 inositol monophosphatase family protein [Synechococcus sp. CCY9202]MEA5475925.1 inositol monophosphatase family protein [Synechococcus sp. CCY9201]CAK6694131.1 Inositol-1-monophosphatase [Synechococcus sp. CBW1107]